VSARGREADAGDLAARIAEAVRASLSREVARIEPLAGALSLRRFARVWLAGDPRTLIARVDAEEDPAGRPVGIPPEPPLEPVRALFEAGGLPVPRRLGGDPRGIELLEDVGSASLRELASGADPELRDALYREVCGWIPRIQSLADPGGVPAFGRHLSAAHFAYKADLFARYSLARGGRAASPAQVACVADAFAAIGRAAAAAPPRLAHRDLHSENVMVRSSGGRHTLAMIDLQGALCTAPEYDLVCVLRDSYVELTPGEIDRHFERTWRALPDRADPEAARQRFDCLTLTRKGKDHARFVYAAAERGDDRYLPFLAATLRHLRAAAAAAAARDPALAPLGELIHALPEPPCAP
jgi:aminoglycoside/choline kinase family phosphotransferase